MKGVVHLVDCNPIDITAAIIRAYIEKKHGNSYSLEWVLDSSANPDILNDLKKMSQCFNVVGFDIRVSHQDNIAEFNPTVTQAQQTLMEIATPFIGEEIRIHHGALSVANYQENFRSFSLSRDGELFLISDAKKKSDRIMVKYDKAIAGVKYVGSLNLVSLANYGEIVHLPWYCLSTGIAPFTVKEVISTPEGCSIEHFSAGEKRLNPSGYSLDDYTGANAATYLMDKLIEYGSVIGFRTKEIGDNSLNKIIIGEVNKTFAQIEKTGFETFSQHMGCEILSVEQCIQSLCDIICAARIIERIERGYSSQTIKYGIEIVPDYVTPLLNSQLRKCYRFMEFEWDSVLDTAQHIGLYARKAMDKGNIYLQRLVAQVFYDKKATLPSLLDICGNVDNLLNSIERLLQTRKEKFVTVTGSIFELC